MKCAGQIGYGMDIPQVCIDIVHDTKCILIGIVGALTEGMGRYEIGKENVQHADAYTELHVFMNGMEMTVQREKNGLHGRAVNGIHGFCTVKLIAQGGVNGKRIESHHIAFIGQGGMKNDIMVFPRLGDKQGSREKLI